ncbi:MAG: hypothetical protein U0V54_05850 [Saprospiraceae bacterium]
MNRKEFIQSAGWAGLALSLPKISGSSHKKWLLPPDTCVLIPTETAGPFPLDLTENTKFFRKDIRDGKSGVQLNMKLRIVGANNCEPMQNVRVNIWHCDKDGVYSGYNTNNNNGDVNAINFRGYQFTDANGEVEFITIFPGWYSGRIAHIHFQVAVSSSYSAVSQLTWDIAAKNAVYAANSGIYTKGADPLTYSTDNIFNNGYTQQLATLTPNTATSGYNSYLEVTVQGTGTTGVGHIENEIAKVLELKQNYPNPFKDSTSIAFELKYPSHTSLEIWGLQGRKVKTVIEEFKYAGSYVELIRLSDINLTPASYVYQLVVKNEFGTFRLPKMMTHYQ